MLTIKEAKEYRCSDDRCKHWHHTCRRCELHTGLWSFNRKSGLCDECYNEYRKWYSEEITKPAIKAFDKEREAGDCQPEGSPFMLMQAYTEWMKEAPRKNRRVIDI